MLLEVNCLDEEWEGNIGMLIARYVVNNLPFALQQLNDGWDTWAYASGLGPDDDRTGSIVKMKY